MRRLALALALIVLAACQPRVTAQSASVYVHWLAQAGSTVNVRAVDGSWAGSGVTNAYGAGGFYVPRRAGAFALSSPGGCVAKAPVGATVSLCAARFELPDGDSFGDFVIETATETPEATASPAATATGAPVTGEVYTCNDVRHIEVITNGGKTTVLVICGDTP